VFLDEGEDGFVCEWSLQLPKEKKKRRNKKIIKLLRDEDRDLFISKTEKNRGMRSEKWCLCCLWDRKWWEKEGFVWMKRMMTFKENESINAKQETHEEV